MTLKVERTTGSGADLPPASPVPDSVLLILAEPHDERLSWAREICLRQGWKYRVSTTIDRMAWTASVSHPAAVLLLEASWEWTSMVVDSVRGATSSPVVLLGALSTDRALMVLREGVDAIIPPALSGEETLARIYAIIRRSSEVLAPSTRYLETGKVRLDLWQSTLNLEGDQVHLTSIEIKLLAFLMRNSGSTLEPRRIVEHVWQSHGSGGENALRIAIGRLRSKLGDDARSPQLIGVVRGRGYKFIPPVVEIPDEERSAASRNTQVEYLDSIASLARAFASCSTSHELHSFLVDHFIESGFADAAAVHVVSDNKLILSAHRGLSDEWVVKASETSLDQRYASARAIQASTPVHSTSASRSYPFTTASLHEEGPGEYIFLPIEVDGTMRACVGLVRRSARVFDAASLAYLRAALAMLAGFIHARKS